MVSRTDGPSQQVNFYPASSLLVMFCSSVTCMDFMQFGNKRFTVAACQGSYVRLSITDVTALSKDATNN